jgi:hypothetical protein
MPAKLTAVTAAITLGLATAALASSPGTHGRSQSAPGHNRTQQTSSTPTTGTSSTPSPSNNGKAYGRLCQSESKKHVAGQKGTPFSQCVKGAKQLKDDEQADPAGSDDQSPGADDQSPGADDPTGTDDQSPAADDPAGDDGTTAPAAG